jgi:hypothetical protein
MVPKMLPVKLVDEAVLLIAVKTEGPETWGTATVHVTEVPLTLFGLTIVVPGNTPAPVIN